MKFGEKNFRSKHSHRWAATDRTDVQSQPAFLHEANILAKRCPEMETSGLMPLALFDRELDTTVTYKFERCLACASPWDMGEEKQTYWWRGTQKWWLHAWSHWHYWIGIFFFPPKMVRSEIEHNGHFWVLSYACTDLLLLFTVYCIPNLTVRIRVVWPVWNKGEKEEVEGWWECKIDFRNLKIICQ